MSISFVLLSSRCWIRPAIINPQEPVPEPVAGRPLDPRLSKVYFPYDIDQERIKLRSNKQIIVAIRGENLPKIVQDCGGRVLTQTPSVVTASMTIEQVLKAIASPSVKLVSFGRDLSDRQISSTTFRRNLINTKPAPRQVLRTPAVQAGGLDRVHRGDAPLAQAYRGKGVLVGVIEGSMPDFRHPDFRNSDGSTRFRAIWDMNLPGKGPTGYGYGTLYQPSNINRLLKSGRADYMVFGEESEHVTNSIGATVGNGTVSPTSTGVAPEADIIYVAASHYNVNIIDAAAFIFREADRLGMPCVINLSTGNDHLQGRAETGNEACSLALSEMVEAKPGRIIANSAGNNASATLHASLSTEDGKILWLYPVTSRPVSNYTSTLLFEGNDRHTAQFQVRTRLVNKTSSQLLALTSWMSADDLEKSGPKEFDLISTIGGIKTGVQLSCIPRWDSPTSRQVGLHFPTVMRDPKSQDKVVIEVGLRGSGRAEAWTEMFQFMLGPDTEKDRFLIPNNLVQPDSLRTISSPANGRSVIAVGAYDDMKFEITDYSQLGGIYFNTWKPFVSAPTNVRAANPLDSPMEDKELVEGGSYAIYSGTSCASPVFTGAAALYLQKHPKATLTEFLHAVKHSADTDANTGPVPNSKTGFGKLNFFKLLQL